MTKREFFTQVAENENVTAHIRTFAQEAIDKIDKANAKRASKPSKTAEANEPIKAQILEFVAAAEGAVGAKTVAEAIGVTTQKASSLMVQMAKAGVLVREETEKKAIVYTVAA